MMPFKVLAMVGLLDTSFSLDTARSSLDCAVRAVPALADLAAIGAGVSTDGMRAAGVPVGVDAWVKIFVAKKAQSVWGWQLAACAG